MFSNKDLRNLIIPLFIEQFLLMFVGIADTFAVSFSGDADVSGVSLVTSFNTVLIFLFTALSSGGAVIISQYIGGKNKKAASRSAGQLLMISTVISMIMAALILVFRTQLLRLLFGKIEADVMAACESYLWITTLSLPFLAVYDAGAALCRSIGKTNVTMNVSVIANVINVIGNCIGVFRAENGSSGRCMAVTDITCVFRCRNHILLLPKEKLGAVSNAGCFCMGRQFAEEGHGHCAAQRR